MRGELRFFDVISIKGCFSGVRGGLHGKQDLKALHFVSHFV